MDTKPEVMEITGNNYDRDLKIIQMAQEVLDQYKEAGSLAGPHLWRIALYILMHRERGIVRPKILHESLKKMGFVVEYHKIVQWLRLETENGRIEKKSRGKWVLSHLANKQSHQAESEK